MGDLVVPVFRAVNNSIRRMWREWFSHSPDSLDVVDQERAEYLSRNATAFAGPWVGPAGARPLDDTMKMTTELVQPGMFVLLKVRIGVAAERVKSPFELGRVRDIVPFPSHGDIGEDTAVPIEFLFADKCDSWSCRRVNCCRACLPSRLEHISYNSCTTIPQMHR